MVVGVVDPTVMTTERPPRDIEPMVPELPRTIATDGGTPPRTTDVLAPHESEAPLVPDVR